MERSIEFLYAPGLRDLGAIRTVCAAVTKPVNILVPGPHISVAELADAGAKRISLGSTLATAAFGAFVRAAREMKSRETFRFCEEAISYTELEGFFSGATRG